MAINDVLLRGTIRHAVYIERFKAGLVRDMLNTLELANESLYTELITLFRENDPETSPRLIRIRKLIRAMLTEREKNLASIGETMTDELVNYAEYEAGFLVGQIQDALPVSLDVITPVPAQVASAAYAKPFEGVLMSQALTRFNANDAAMIERLIINGYVNGYSGAHILRAIMGTKTAGFTNGAVKNTINQLTAIVRTATQHYAAQASEMVWSENSDLLKGLQWVATLDGRTTPICRGRDGDVWRVDDPKRPAIPAHWQCRSRWVPVVKSWRELGYDYDEINPATRASLNGQVPAKMTYEEFLRGETAEFQRESFKTAYHDWQEKYKLWKTGGLTVDRFVNIRTGHEYTLAELMAREKVAFLKARVTL